MGAMEAREPIHVVICDDDPVMLPYLRELTEKTLAEETLVLRTALSPDELDEQARGAHILILDIQMPEQSGIALAQDILRDNPGSQIVFVSGFVRYVSDVYDVPHVAMVMKDRLEEQLPKFLLRAARQARMRAVKWMTVQFRGKEERILASNVCYLERSGHVTRVYLQSGQCLQTREKLDSLINRTGEPTFCRCHVSYAVNLRWVSSLEGQGFRMQNGERLPISRIHLHKAREAFFGYLQAIT